MSILNLILIKLRNVASFNTRIDIKSSNLIIGVAMYVFDGFKAPLDIELITNKNLDPLKN